MPVCKIGRFLTRNRKWGNIAAKEMKIRILVENRSNRVLGLDPVLDLATAGTSGIQRGRDSCSVNEKSLTSQYFHSPFTRAGEHRRADLATRPLPTQAPLLTPRGETHSLALSVHAVRSESALVVAAKRGEHLYDDDEACCCEVSTREAS